MPICTSCPVHIILERALHVFIDDFIATHLSVSTGFLALMYCDKCLVPCFLSHQCMIGAAIVASAKNGVSCATPQSSSNFRLFEN